MDRELATDKICIDFEGYEIHCRAGISLAAALTDAHKRDFRDAGDGDMRGLFCGMGVCQECRMTVDDRHGTRACMTVVRESLKVSRDIPRPALDSRSRPLAENGDYEIVQPEVLVIGAGPAGLTAASVAAESGADVILLDERSIAGGQYYKQPSSPEHVPKSLSGDRQFADGRALIERAQRSGASLLQECTVWGAFEANEFAVFDGEYSRIYKPKRTIVATGAYERGLPIPGWTLPGAMTTGAAQTLLRSYGVLPGARVLVAGNGPLNLQVALELKRAGADVLAVAELSAPPGPSSFMNGLRMALSAPGPTMNGVRLLAGLHRSGVPVLYRQGLVSIDKHESALRAWIGQTGRDGIAAETSFDVDTVCMGYGFQPNNEILRSLGCGHTFDEKRGHLVTKRGPYFETDVTNVYAIGDCCGLGGAPAASEEAIIAASDVLRSLGHVLPARVLRQEKLALKNLGRHRKFQTALWQMFAAPRFQTELARPDTLICRCENLRLQDLEAALADGHPSIGTLKRRTRLGMGACQGRYCAPVAAAMIAERDGHAVNELSFFAPRIPLKPISIADMIKTSAS